MFVQDGARAQLLESEKQKFIHQEWPEIKRRIERLGLAVDELLANKAEDSDHE